MNRKILLIILVLISVLVLAGAQVAQKRLTVAILPCVPLKEATNKVCGWLEAKLEREFRSQVIVVSKEKVSRTLQKKGIENPLKCDDSCMADLGKSLSLC